MKTLNKLAIVASMPIACMTTGMFTSCGCARRDVFSDIPSIHESAFYQTPSIANVIYTVSGLKADDPMMTTLQSLQGILAQTQAQIFVYSGNKRRDEWFKDMKTTYGFKTVSVSNPWDLIKKFKDSFGSKFVLYKKATGIQAGDIDTRDWNLSINKATNIASVNKCLMVSDELYANNKKIIDDMGLTLYANANEMTCKEVFDACKSQLSNKMLINQSPYDLVLRDYAIASKSYTGYIEFDDIEPGSEGLRKEVSEWLASCAPILGWNNGELDFVETESKENLVVVASDHCYNLSLYSAYKSDFCLKQKHRPKIQAQSGKHYLAMVMTDGDNIQWLQESFRDKSWYGSKYRGDFPMTWTISPSTFDLNISILKELYGTMKDNDYFAASASGFGYINPAFFPDTDKFGKLTSDYMHDCDLQYINIIDFHNWNVEALKPIIQQEYVKGAVWSVEDLYLDGHGSVDWIDDKPIVSMREGLWVRGNPEVDSQPYLIEPVAQRINSYPTDPTKIDGYTVLVAHCWSEGRMERIHEFVKLLDKHVELVTVDQILDMISENVPHVHAEPEQHAPDPFEPWP